MSEDGFSDPYDEPGMDLTIETLTGTSFEMRVYPTDTVLDIKNKIHRVEGIPVHHQNLLFHMKELQDYIRLCDAGIVSGSSLKLVLSMRGGPISTRRLSTCDHHVIWKDLKDLIEHTRDEIGDKSGSKVSVLVFKEGEVLNVIRVIENEDGSYSPYADNKAVSPPYAPAGGNGRYKEKEDLQQTFFKKITEDMEMATKMHVLRAKMKKLRQQRKTEKNNNNKTSLSSGVNLDDDSSNNSNSCKNNGGAGDFNGGKSFSVSGGDFIEIELPTAVTGDAGSNGDYKMIESLISVQENVENLEIALKEKHRTRVRGVDSTERFCKNLHVFEPDKKEGGGEEEKKKMRSGTSSSILSPLYNRYSSDSGVRHRRTSQLSFEEVSKSDDGAEFQRRISRLGFEDAGEEPKAPTRRVSQQESSGLRGGGEEYKTRRISHLNHLNFEDGGGEEFQKHRRLGHLSFEDGGDELKHRRLSHLSFNDGGDELKHRRLSHLSFDDGGGDEFKQDDGACSETLSLTARNRVHLTRLVIQDSSEARGKSSPDSIELEENSPSEMWEIQPETIKSSGAYKVGLLQRRSSVDHNFDGDFGLEGSASNLNLEREDFNQNTDYEVFGRNFYHVPQFISTPSAIPPQYVPKDERICDLYLGSPVSDTKIRRSPLYGRRSKNSDFNLFTEEEKKTHNSNNGAQFVPKLHSAKNENNFAELASNIERLQNDYTELDYEDFDSINYTDDMFNYYNSTCTSDLDKLLHPRFKEPSSWTDAKTDDAQLANEIKRLSFDIKIDDAKPPAKVQIDDLPAVVSKKRMRCGHCNKRLNITNIYNCRCGRIFCSQHRYSESHDCKYDYKSEGRKLLEQQNPLVTATKLTKF